MNEMPSAAVRVACDVGGTFTDVCILDEATGRMRVAKTPTTPDPIDGVLNGIAAGGVDLKDVVLFSHGTTLATNALITRNFPPAIMVTTRGFRDVIEIRRGTRDDLWDTYKEMAPPYIKRRDRLVVTERIDYSGAVIEPVNEAEAREAARIINKRGVKTIAVCFANAFANPENERRMRDILEEEVPGASISLSSEIMPEIFEHERFSTTVANAVLAPVAGDYVKRLAARLREGGYDEDILLLHSGGGVMTEKTAEKFAARLAASGIAAGAIASQFVAKLAGYENSISLDMGGTSTDVSLCDRGTLRVTTDWYVQYGYPICFPSIEVLTIGAGGGSLAWIDEANSLRNGPQSAGSAPGPACYGRGGAEPTNSDANIVLGRISDRLAGGAVHPRPRPRRGRHQAPRRRPARALAAGGRGLDPQGRQCQHGGRRAPGLDPTRLRSARLRACRVRRRRPAARRGAGPRPFDPDRSRAAEPRRHLGARLPAGRHQARHVADVSAVHRRRQDRRDRGDLPRAGRRRPPAPPARRRDRGSDAVPALRRHALSRPVALDVDRGRGEFRLARRSDRAVPRRARPRAQLFQARRAGRDLSPHRHRHRALAQGGVRQGAGGPLGPAPCKRAARGVRTRSPSRS